MHYVFHKLYIGNEYHLALCKCPSFIFVMPPLVHVTSRCTDEQTISILEALQIEDILQPTYPSDWTWTGL